MLIVGADPSVEEQPLDDDGVPARRSLHKASGRGRVIGLVAVAVGLAAGVTLFYSGRAPALTERDAVLLADFVNTTGESVFDGALKQALAVHLEQSPYLNIVPDERVRETLRYMRRSPDERVTPGVAREICERQSIKAMLTGSISRIGKNYVIDLTAVNCRTGEALAREQVEAESQERVLDALGAAASTLRGKLGESLASIEKFDAPIEQGRPRHSRRSRPSRLARSNGRGGRRLRRRRFSNGRSSWIEISR